MLEQRIAKAPPTLAPLDEANWRAIRVQNVPPSLIAFQLDPVHNKMPAFVNVPYTVPPKYAANYKEPEGVKGPFALPNVVQLAASDERNLLFVAGANAAQIAQLQELVDILDQPLRQVELEARLVELSVTQLKEFGIEFNGATPDAPKTQMPIKGAFQVGFVRNNFQKRLDEMVAAGTVTIVSTAPLTLTNNGGQAVSLRSGPIDNTGDNQNKMPLATKAGNDTIITLTPTINGDDTITVLMNISTLPQNFNQSGLETIANVRNGDTIALSGLNRSLASLFGATQANAERAIVVFLTARIARDEK